MVQTNFIRCQIREECVDFNACEFALFFFLVKLISSSENQLTNLKQMINHRQNIQSSFASQSSGWPPHSRSTLFVADSFIPMLSGYLILLSPSFTFTIYLKLSIFVLTQIKNHFTSIICYLFQNFSVIRSVCFYNSPHLRYHNYLCLLVISALAYFSYGAMLRAYVFLLVYFLIQSS